jgi:hypothetical protein
MKVARTGAWVPIKSRHETLRVCDRHSATLFPASANIAVQAVLPGYVVDLETRNRKAPCACACALGRALKVAPGIALGD